jgi:hypothetical protein
MAGHTRKNIWSKGYFLKNDGGDEDMSRIDTLLCIRAGNKCSYPTCKLDVYVLDKKTENTLEDDLTNIGEIAHIESNSDDPRSARFNQKMKDDPKLHESYDNKILLCENHHALVDKKKSNEYPPERLKGMRNEHEDWIVKHPESLKTTDENLEYSLDEYINKMKWLSTQLEEAKKEDDVKECKKLLMTATAVYVTNFQWRGEIIKLFKNEYGY